MFVKIILVEMELMIENQKRRKSGQELLGTERIRMEEEILRRSFFENSEHHCHEIFDREASVKALSAHISFRRLCATGEESLSEARRQVERKVHECISDMEKKYVRCVIDRLIMMNEEVRNRLLEYLAPQIFGGIKDTEKFRSMVNSLEEEAGIIGDIADNLGQLRMSGTLQQDLGANNLH